mmetsp:Transcript_9045/g.21797  ORF Transcript_9045/g.21797 Transcript_9045/m.21797 type:complete len:238 (+) Transcript_9045:2029-2742(+)
MIRKKCSIPTSRRESARLPTHAEPASFAYVIINSPPYERARTAFSSSPGSSRSPARCGATLPTEHSGPWQLEPRASGPKSGRCEPARATAVGTANAATTGAKSAAATAPLSDGRKSSSTPVGPAASCAARAEGAAWSPACASPLNSPCASPLNLARTFRRQYRGRRNRLRSATHSRAAAAVAAGVPAESWKSGSPYRPHSPHSPRWPRATAGRRRRPRGSTWRWPLFCVVVCVSSAS